MYPVGITQIAASILAPVLEYLQGSSCMYTHDSRLREHITALLGSAVTSAPDAAQQQNLDLLAVLLRMRANAVLDAAVNPRNLTQVSHAWAAELARLCSTGCQAGGA